jgi:hypothetical protein
MKPIGATPSDHPEPAHLQIPLKATNHCRYGLTSIGLNGVPQFVQRATSNRSAAPSSLEFPLVTYLSLAYHRA